jgi:hypothetical protein
MWVPLRSRDDAVYAESRKAVSASLTFHARPVTTDTPAGQNTRPVTPGRSGRLSRMRRTLAMVGSVAGSSLLGWAGSSYGLMTSFMLGMVGTGLGMYAGFRLAARLGA